MYDIEGATAKDASHTEKDTSFRKDVIEDINQNIVFPVSQAVYDSFMPIYQMLR